MSPAQRTLDEQFTELKRIINADPAIQATLAEATDQATWINHVVQVGKDNGLNVSPDDVVSRIKARLDDALSSGRAIDAIHVAMHRVNTVSTI